MLFSNSNGRAKDKSASFSERANMALSSLQRNAYAMSMLRARLESKINQALSNKTRGPADSQDLAKMLELVKNGESVLNDLSSKVESARLLEEFIVILDSAAESVKEITGDMEKMVPAAELALQEMHNTILKTSMGLSTEQEEKSILDEASAASMDAAPAPIVQETDMSEIQKLRLPAKSTDKAKILEDELGEPEPVPA